MSWDEVKVHEKQKNKAWKIYELELKKLIKGNRRSSFSLTFAPDLISSSAGWNFTYRKAHRHILKLILLLL